MFRIITLFCNGIDIATKIFQQMYCKITAPVIGLSHFGDACLGTGQSRTGGSLNHCAIIRDRRSLSLRLSTESNFHLVKFRPSKWRNAIE
jgi:hypothetical protein